MSSADRVTLKVDLAAFKKALASFGDKVEKQIVANAVGAAAKVFKAYIVAAAPELKREDKRKKGRPAVRGLLKKAVYIFRPRQKQAGQVSAVVSFKKRKKTDAYYGRWLELGWVARGPGKAIKGGNRRKRLERARQRSAGATERKFPFLSPGFKRAERPALDAFEKALEKGINEANK